MKIIFKFIRPILVSCFVLIFFACEQEPVNETVVGVEEAITASEVKDESKIWQELEVIHTQVQEKLNALSLPENPVNEKIPNPFLPLIQVNAYGSGNAVNITSRSYGGTTWFERSDYKRVDGESTKSEHWPNHEHYEMYIGVANYGDHGYIRPNFDINVYNQNHKNPRHYRLVIERLDGSTWVPVIDKSGTITPQYWTEGNHGDALYLGDSDYVHYKIEDNNQRNKWYRCTIYGYVDYPNESVWRHITVSAYLEKFDPGF